MRGGSEKGNEWYLAGKKSTKRNSWKDFNASAQWLINNKYTSPEKLAVWGTSAGGMLIGRAITERPDLYKVAVPNVGALNMLRLEFSPYGPANIPEFGTVTKKDEFQALFEMDAFHHIKNNEKYPAQLIKTGFNDPRVASYFPGKFAAKMQAENRSKNPVFLYVNFGAGHGQGNTLDDALMDKVDELSFILWQTGHPDFQPKNDNQ